VSPKLSIGVLQARRDARLKELAGVGPVLEGSLARIGVRCGNPNCRCARGQKHTAHILKRQVRGKTQSLYVPVDLVEEARHWVEEYRRARGVLREVSELNRAILRAHVGSKRAKARHRAAAAGPADC
jgi:hypothetical protein